MPSEIEKIVLTTNCLEAERFLPNFRDSPLGISFKRRRRRFRLLNMSGMVLQSLTIHLPTRGERKGVEEYPCGGNHVPGQTFGQETSKILRSRDSLRPRHDIAHQLCLPRSCASRRAQFL